jgi:hypothetical protein
MMIGVSLNFTSQIQSDFSHTQPVVIPMPIVRGTDYFLRPRADGSFGLEQSQLFSSAHIRSRR